MPGLNLLVGLLPVLLFLGALLLMDSYRLVGRRAVLLAIAAGCAAAVLAALANHAVLAGLRLEPALLRRYVAPVSEEVLKAAYVVYLVRAHRVGFLVDAGILGFATGTGFALVENVYYAAALGRHGVFLWIVRGLGTAVMHGSTTAVVGILYKDLADRRDAAALRLCLPGLAVAVATHSFFNHLVLNPLVTTALLLTLMPLLLVAVYERSERATRAWLEAGMDSEVELLEVILGARIAESRVGRYLESLRARFPGAVMADLLCLLRVHLELALQAKGVLIARAAGVRVPPSPEVRDGFAELRYLERSVGATGRLALHPFLRTSSRDLWQLYRLRE